VFLRVREMADSLNDLTGKIEALPQIENIQGDIATNEDIVAVLRSLVIAVNGLRNAIGGEE